MRIFLVPSVSTRMQKRHAAANLRNSTRLSYNKRVIVIIVDSSINVIMTDDLLNIATLDDLEGDGYLLSFIS